METKCNKCAYCKNEFTPKEISFADLLNQYDKILIPKIQRDYAQGRDDEKAESVRKRLLKDIFSGKEVKFDFVFGTKQHKIDAEKTENCFIPLDGQQRLTTLFLLYLYGIKNGKIKTAETIHLNKFSYDTRRAAKDFCKAIVENTWTFMKTPTISDSIKNCKWFLDYWQYDPTVSSMLTMLNAIHEKAKKHDYPNLDNIKFYFFDMDEHKLNENLYLKMNSRGKPLTAFENIKSSIDKILPTHEIKADNNPFSSVESEEMAHCKTFAEKWKYCIDKQWANLFWEFKEDFLIDAPFLRFLSNCLAGFWINSNKGELDENNEILSKLLAITGKEPFIPFEIFESVFQQNGAFEYCAKVLSDFAIYKDNIIIKSKPSWIKDGYSIMHKILNNPTFNDLSILYAITQYKNTEYDNENFRQWMRFCWNITENVVERKREYISAVKLFSELSDNSNDILSFLADEKSIITSGFAKEQVAEERKKAKKTKESGEWKTKIETAENYAFFSGAIRFLFTDEKGEVNWDDFDTKFENAKKYFDENGVKDTNVVKYKTDAVLLKAVISRCSNFWEYVWWEKYIFDNEPATWKKNFLLSQNWHFSIHEMLMGNLTIKKHDDIDQTFKNLFETNLLNYVANNEKGSRLRNIYGHKAIYPPYCEGILFHDNRNKLLSQLFDDGEITSKQKIPYCDFFWGWNIWFKWNEKDVSWAVNWNNFEKLKCGNVEIDIKGINDIEALKQKLDEITVF